MHFSRAEKHLQSLLILTKYLEHLGSLRNIPEKATNQTEIIFLKRKRRTIPRESQGHGKVPLQRGVSEVKREKHRDQNWLRGWSEFHSKHLQKETLRGSGHGSQKAGWTHLKDGLPRTSRHLWASEGPSRVRESRACSMLPLCQTLAKGSIPSEEGWRTAGPRNLSVSGGAAEPS